MKMEGENEAAEKTSTSDRTTRLLVLGLFTLLAIFLTWPVLPNLASEYAGGRSDLLVHQWTFWWLKQALLNGQNPFYTTLLYYPEGVPLLSHNIAWLNIAFWLPVQAVIGEIAAYNVMFIAIFTLNGFATYLFARDVIKRLLPSFLAGLIVCSWPYILSHYDHPNMILVFPLPLALLYLGRAIKGQRWRDAWLAGLFLAILGIGRWQLLLMSLPLLAGYVLYLLLKSPPEGLRKALGRLAIAGGLALLLMLGPALPLIQSQLQEGANQIDIVEPDNGRTDLMAYFITPQTYNRIWGEEAMAANPLLLEGYDLIGASDHYIPFIGYMTLILAALGLLKRWRQSRFWLFVALFYVIFALGPQLAVNGHLFFERWMPYRLLLEDTLIGDLIRRPHRLNIILSVPVALIAAWGVDALLCWRPISKKTRAPVMVLAFMATIVLVDSRRTSPFITTLLEPPAWYQQLAEEPGSFGLVEIPIHNRWHDKWYMSYQTRHGKPIVAGHISRMPAEAWQALGRFPWLLYSFENDDFPDFGKTVIGRELRRLAEDNIPYVVLNKPFLNEGLTGMWRDWLTIDPAYEDNDVIVYRTSLAAGEDFDIEHSVTGEIGIIRTSYAPLDSVQGGLIKVDVRWGSTATGSTATGSTAAPSRNALVCLELLPEGATSTAFPTDNAACNPLAPGYPTSEWPANEVVRGAYQLPVGDDQPPGDYQLFLGLVDVESREVLGETIALGPQSIQANAPQNRLALRWQNGIELSGYDLEQTETTLVFRPTLQIGETVTNSYKLFVHVNDPEDGEILAQVDVVPRNWTYPTNIWEAGEVIRDEIAIPIDHLLPGDYELWLGWYDEITGERVLSEQGEERVLIR